MKTFNKKSIQKEVIKMTDDSDLDSGANMVGQILLASLLKGGNEKKIAKYLSMDLDFVNTIGEKLRESGVWKKNGKIVCEWFDKDTGGIAFNMDIAVGLGYLARHN